MTSDAMHGLVDVINEGKGVRSVRVLEQKVAD